MAVQQKVKPRKKHKCPPHHFIINSDNVGHCIYYPEVRDFARLLRREGVFAVAGRRGAKARKEVLSKKSKQSDAMKELWQDPEYQAKQRAGHVSLPSRHHKKEELL